MHARYMNAQQFRLVINSTHSTYSVPDVRAFLLSTVLDSWVSLWVHSLSRSHCSRCLFHGVGKQDVLHKVVLKFRKYAAQKQAMTS